MTGIQITNKKKLTGRNAKAHIARKLSMPYAPGVENINDNYPDIKRTYNVYQKTGGRRTVLHESNNTTKTTALASHMYTGKHRDEVKKGKWV